MASRLAHMNSKFQSSIWDKNWFKVLYIWQHTLMPFSIVIQIHVVPNLVSKFNVSLMQEIKQLDLNIEKKPIKNLVSKCIITHMLKMMWESSHLEPSCF
jgi:hypothetical protein